MRMTNEEFQAEVFRRSEIYMKERQVRRRKMFTGALAFCGCLAVGIAAQKLLPIFNHSKLQSAMSDYSNVIDNILADPKKQDTYTFSAEKAEQAASNEESYAEYKAECEEAADLVCQKCPEKRCLFFGVPPVLFKDT